MAHPKICLTCKHFEALKGEFGQVSLVQKGICNVLVGVTMNNPRGCYPENSCRLYQIIEPIIPVYRPITEKLQSLWGNEDVRSL